MLCALNAARGLAGRSPLTADIRQEREGWSASPEHEHPELGRVGARCRGNERELGRLAHRNSAAERDYERQ